LLFDLDGTLIDSMPDVLAAVNHTLIAHGRAGLKLAALLPAVGKGLAFMLEQAFRMTGDPLAPADMSPASRLYTDFYRDFPLGRGQVYPGVAEILERLRSDGYQLGVCTNKPDVLAEAVLGEAGIRPYFAAVVGGDTPRRKPDPHHLVATLHCMGGDCPQAVMIGDSEHDVVAARAAGVPAIVVTWGYSGRPAHELGGDAVIDRMAQLPNALQRLAPRSAQAASD
jgi:phosphoglycolate phosphatase